MRSAGNRPHFWRIHPGNQDLAIGELQQSGKIGFHVRNRQTFRKKNNWPARAMQSSGHGIIVTDRILPLVQNAALLKDAFANSSASAPAEIFRSVFTEHEHDGPISVGTYKR